MIKAWLFCIKTLLLRELIVSVLTLGLTSYLGRILFKSGDFNAMIKALSKVLKKQLT
jgi:hypothetical protein